MKLYMSLLAVALFTFGIVSCNDDDNDSSSTSSDTTTFKATLNGSSEVPANASTATGNALFTFNNTTKILAGTVTYSGLTPNNGHIHKGATGVSGGVVFGFTSLASPISYTSPALDASQEADLKANLYYINLHTDAYMDGEIRGQLIKQTSSGGGGGGGY